MKKEKPACSVHHKPMFLQVTGIYEDVYICQVFGCNVRVKTEGSQPRLDEKE